MRISWVTAEVCSWTSHNISSAPAATVWLCSRDYHDRFWVVVRVQTWRVSAMFTVLSTQNVRTLLYGDNVCTTAYTNPEFIQLFDDDIVSLIALALIVDPKRLQAGNVFISQLTLSLYLMTQCQLKLRTLLSNVTGSDIRLHRSHWKKKNPADRTLDHLTLKLTERKLMIYLSTNMQHWFMSLTEPTSVCCLGSFVHFLLYALCGLRGRRLDWQSRGPVSNLGRDKR